MKTVRFTALSVLTFLALGCVAAGCGGGVSTGFDAVSEEISAPVIEAREDREERKGDLVPEAVKTLPHLIGTLPSSEDGALPIEVADPSDAVSPPADTPDTNEEQVVAAGLSPVTVEQQQAPGELQEVQANYQVSAERQTQPNPVHAADTAVVYEDRSTPPTPHRRTPCLLGDCR